MEHLISQMGVNIDFAFILLFGGLIWTRILSMMSVIPFLFAKPVPAPVRTGMSLAMAIFVYPLIAPKIAPQLDFTMLHILALFLKEVLVGLAIGFAGGIFFYGFQSAGSLIDGQRGTALARVLIPELGEQSVVSGQFLFLFTVVLYFALGGDQLFLGAFFESFRALPVLDFPPMGIQTMPLMDLFGTLTATVFYIALQISFPILIAIFLIDIILGVANRFAPQINVWELGFNIRGYVGILFLFLALTMIAGQVEKYMHQSVANVGEVIQKFNPPPEPPPQPTAEPEPLPAQVIP